MTGAALDFAGVADSDQLNELDPHEISEQYERNGLAVLRETKDDGYTWIVSQDLLPLLERYAKKNGGDLRCAAISGCPPNFWPFRMPWYSYAPTEALVRSIGSAFEYAWSMWPGDEDA